MDGREAAYRIGQLEAEIAYLRQAVSSIPIRMPVGAGGGLVATTVAALPAIPTSVDFQLVLWGDDTLITGGTGDNNFWFAAKGATRWTPFPCFTDSEGDPPA